MVVAGGCGWRPHADTLGSSGGIGSLPEAALSTAAAGAVVAFFSHSRSSGARREARYGGRPWQ